MKERIETIIDSFTDFSGKTHHFVIAAISQNLPTSSRELGYDFDDAIKYEIEEYVENYGTTDYVGSVSKVLRLGISICNPVDTFDEHVGSQKAIHRARAAKPVIYAANPGVINSHMVKALLEQEASYLKDNPERFITGYSEAKKRYLKDQKMEEIEKNLSEVEIKVVEELKKDSTFLDKVIEYFNWKCKK